MSIAFRDLPVYDLTGATRNFEQLVAFQFKGKALEGGLEEPTFVKPEAFKGAEALGFKNEWKNLEAGNKAEYRKTPFGTVELRGVIASGKSGLEAFKLPEGYRPKSACDWIVVANANTALLEVTSAGAVIPTNLGGEVKVNTVLNPVSFSVE